MSRYDVDKFNPTPDPDLVCCICTCILDEPLVSPCQHVFCKVCIHTWLERKKTCPTCRTRLVKDDLQPVLPMVRNMLNRLTMVCDFRENGCETVLHMEQFDAHVKDCQFEMVTCRFERCRRKLLRRDINRHENDECDFKEITCPTCELDVPVKEMPVHDCIVSLKTRLKGLNKTIADLDEALKSCKEEVSSMAKKLEEQRWNNLDDSWDSNSSWDSWDSHTDYSGSYIYSDDGRSSNTETNSPFQLSLPPPLLPSVYDPLGLSSGITIRNTTHVELVPSTSLSTAGVTSFTNTGVNSHSQDDTLSASENSDNSDRHRRRQNQRLVSERPHTDTSQNRSLMEAYTNLGTAVEEAFRNSAQNVLQSRYCPESVTEPWSSPLPQQGGLPNVSSVTPEYTVFESSPASPAEHSVNETPHSRSRSRSSVRSRNSLNSSKRRSRSYDHSYNSRSASADSDYWPEVESSVKSRSLEHSSHSDTELSEDYDRSRSRSCSTGSSEYFSRKRKISKHSTKSRSECSERSRLQSFDRSTRSRSRSFDRSFRSRSKSFDHSTRSRSRSFDRSFRSRSRSFDCSTRSRSKSSERSSRSRSKSSERSSQNVVGCWLRNLNRSSRSRSLSSENSGKYSSKFPDTRRRSVSSEHSVRKGFRSGHRSRKSWSYESSHLSDNNSNKSLSGHSRNKPHVKSRSGRIKSSDYSCRSRSRSVSENSDRSIGRSFHSRDAKRSRSHSSGKHNLIARDVFNDSSSSESEASTTRSRHSSRHARKRFKSVSRNNDRNQKSGSDFKSYSSNNSQSQKRLYKRMKRDISSSSNSTDVESSHPRNPESVEVEPNLEAGKKTVLKNSSSSESTKRQLKKCSQNSNKSNDKTKCQSAGTSSFAKEIKDSVSNNSSTENNEQPGISNISASAVSCTSVMTASETEQDNGIQNSQANNSLVVCNGNPKKRKRGSDHDSNEAGKNKRIAALTTENHCQRGDAAKVNVEIHLSVLNFSGDLHNRSSASNAGTRKVRSCTTTKCSSDVDSKKSTENNQKINETQNALDMPCIERQSTALRNKSKQDSNAANSTSNSCVAAYSFRKSTVDKVLAQSSKGSAETSREGTRRSSRQVKPCNLTASSPVLPSYFMEDDSDDSWTPTGLHEDSDAFSESDLTGSDSSYEVQVPKPLMQVIDEMVEGDESDRSWTPNS